MLTRTTSRISVPFLLFAAALMLLASSVTTARVAALPIGPDFAMARAQNVDWMSAEQAAALDLSFPVMVPAGIPAPFDGSPAISGGGGYYSLYWVNYGGPPTFLQVTGEVGGSLPAGSPADLNVELSVNASVQGYEAIHDVTSIYDNVWWVAGGVLYTVSSNNMTGTDSLSLANSLLVLESPVAPEPEPDPPTPAPTSEPTRPAQQEQEEPTVPDPEPDAVSDEPGTGSNESDTGSAESDTGSDEPESAPEEPDTGLEEPVEPDDQIDTEVEVVEDVEGDDAEVVEDVGPTETDDTSAILVESSVLADIATITAPSSGADADVDDEDEVQGIVTLSDGTGGAALPSGGDGTGGIRQVAIP